jgi:hypothetical protein
LPLNATTVENKKFWKSIQYTVVFFHKRYTFGGGILFYDKNWPEGSATRQSRPDSPPVAFPAPCHFSLHTDRESVNSVLRNLMFTDSVNHPYVVLY